MLYFATPTCAGMPHMLNHTLGYIDTPRQANIRPPGVIWCADNGCYTDNWDAEQWWNWLQRNSKDTTRCAFATAPDVVGDAHATLRQSTEWLPRIRALGYPPAYVAQDGVTDTPLPWDSFTTLFLGGTNTFKLGLEARAITTQARARGKWVHCGRVNSLKRWRYAEAIGCHSADGTFLKHGPDKRLPELLGWLDDLHQRPALFDLTNQQEFTPLDPRTWEPYQ